MNKILLKAERKSDYLDTHHGKLISIRNEEENICTAIKRRFKLDLFNDHIVLSVLRRDLGTNYTTPQRVLVYTLYIFFILCISALFFEQEQNSKFSELVFVFIATLIALIPVRLIKYIFIRCRPSDFKPYKVLLEEVRKIHRRNTTDGGYDGSPRSSPSG
eukprot:UN29771